MGNDEDVRSWLIGGWTYHEGLRKGEGASTSQRSELSSTPNQATWLGWRWTHRKLLMAATQGRALGTVPLNGKWKKRYRELVLGLVRYE
jgi:hypothetical protein